MILLTCCAGTGSAQTALSSDASIGVWPWLVGNIDAYQDETTVVYGVGNTAIFQRFIGTFDSLGTTAPVFSVPQNVIPGILVGSAVHFAVVGIDGNALFPIFASNPVSIAIRR